MKGQLFTFPGTKREQVEPVTQTAPEVKRDPVTEPVAEDGWSDGKYTRTFLGYTAKRAKRYGNETLALLSTIANQVGGAIDNARLYEEAEQSAEDMSFLFDITTTAASAETLRDALDNVAHQIMYNVRSNIVAIYLTQDYEDYYKSRDRR